MVKMTNYWSGACWSFHWMASHFHLANHYRRAISFSAGPITNGERYGNVTTAFDGSGCCGLYLPESITLVNNIVAVHSHVTAVSHQVIATDTSFIVLLSLAQT